jgi:hypothetical protein
MACLLAKQLWTIDVSAHSDMAAPPESSSSHPRRWPWVVLAVIVVMAVAGTSLYYILEPKTSSVLPTTWSMPGACDQCGVAITAQDVYRLTLVNESEYGDTNYTVAAYNLSTGASAWSSVSVFIQAGFGQYESTFGIIAPFFADNNTLSLVLAGKGESTTGQPIPVNLTYCAIFVFEWNATTGSFLGVQRTGDVGGCLTFVAATQGGGWIVVDWIPSDQYPVTNVSLATFPEQSPSSQYTAWTRNVSIGSLSWEGWPLFPLTIGDGLVTISEMGGNNTTAILDGSSGGTLWEGPLPMWLAAGDNPFGTVGYFDNVVRAGGSLDYIAKNGSYGNLMSFSLTNHSSSLLSRIPVSGGQLYTTELGIAQSGDLTVTDSANGSYYVYSARGQPLWLTQIGLTVDSQPSGGSVSGIAYEPLEMGGGYFFVTIFEDYSTCSGPTGSSCSFTYTDPLLLLNGTTGAALWQSSYTSSFFMGNPGPSSSPVQFIPLLAQGQHLVFLHGLEISIAQFSDLPVG